MVDPANPARNRAAAYFALQGAATVAWWVALGVWPPWRAAFLPPGFPETSLLAFAPADAVLLVAGSWLAAVLTRRGSRWSVPVVWLVAGAVDYATLQVLASAVLTQGGWLAFVLMAPAALLTTAFALALTVGHAPLFRAARPATRARNLGKTLVQIVLFWGFFLGALPALIVAVESRTGVARFAFPGQVPIATVAFLVLSALGLLSAAAMAGTGEGTPLPLDSPRRLVFSGPYAFVRNPMAMAGLGQGLAVGIGLGSWSTTAYALLGSWLWNFVVRPAEEADLEVRFGAEFARYRQAVRCWLPRSRPYRP